MSIAYLGCPSSIYSTVFWEVLLRDIKEVCPKSKLRLVEIHFDDDDDNYTQFDKDLDTMLCSKLLFFIHENNSSEDIVCAGITSKAYVYPNTSSTKRLYGINLKECMLFPLSILDERNKDFCQNVDFYLKNFFVRYILFDGYCKFEDCKGHIRTLCKFHSVEIKSCNASDFYFKEIIINED